MSTIRPPAYVLPSEVLEASHLRWSVLSGFRGSVAHGTYMPHSDPDSIDDLDLMGFVALPPRYYLGHEEFGSQGTVEVKGPRYDPWDVVTYDLRKAVKLLLNGNPNVLAMLWLPSNLYIGCTVEGSRLIAARDAFSGRHVWESFAGYADAQLRKMTRGGYQGYMGPRRRALVDRHGYDTKNAAHLVRLLRQGVEFIRTGKLRVRRSDAELADLRSIRRGGWSLRHVQAHAEELFGEGDEALHGSPLPRGPDREAAEALLVDLVRSAWERQGW